MTKNYKLGNTLHQTKDQQLQNFIRYRNDPWAFLSECVFTLDQVDKINPIKGFPVDREYLHFFAELWLRHLHIAVPKSRRMTMSWTCIALYLWDTVFHKGRFNAFVSKKEEDAGELVERAEFIFDHIPPDKIPKGLLPQKKTKSKPPVLEFPEINSKIQGFPQGANQLRQFTFSGIFGDECSFWEQAIKFYSASRPTLDGGGRMTLVSSRAPGFFKKLVYDTLDEDKDISKLPLIKKPLEGVEFWINKKNQFAIMDIHYTADPEKRSRSFKNAIKSALPLREYLMEYERNWETFEGLPVYADFGNHHLSPAPLEAHLGLPLLLGWDFGLTPACIVAQLQGSQLIILREYIEKNLSINKFAPKVMADLRILYPEWADQQKDFRNYIDPAGHQKAQTDATTCAQVMYGCGLRNIQSGALLFEPRKQAVEQFLIQHTKAGPSLLIHEPDCPALVKGFRGGYRYPDNAGEIEPLKLRPLKDEHSHPHDAFQYLCSGIKSLRTGEAKQIPRANYSFLNQGKQETGALHGYTKSK